MYHKAAKINLLLDRVGGTAVCGNESSIIPAPSPRYATCLFNFLRITMIQHRRILFQMAIAHSSLLFLLSHICHHTRGS